MILRRGTTRQRAEALLNSETGPDALYRDPEGILAQAFSAAPVHGPFLHGSPEYCALMKAAHFPNEGGPAILEVDIPDDLIAPVDLLGCPGKGSNWIYEVRFEPGYGLEELRAVWSKLERKVVLL